MDPLSAQDLPALVPSLLERTLSNLAALGLASLCLIVTTTVVVRALGFALIPDDVLLVQELMLIIILLPLGAVTAQRAQIAVTVFTDRLHLRGKTALALLAHAIGIIFAAALLWVTVSTCMDELASGEYYDGDLHLPTWFGWGVFSFGSAVFLLRLFMLLVRDARWLRGRAHLVND